MKIVKKSKDNGLNWFDFSHFWKSLHRADYTEVFKKKYFCGVCSEKEKKEEKNKQKNLDFENRQFCELKWQ